MARISFVTAREAARRTSRRVRLRTAWRVRVWRTGTRRALRAITPDAADREVLALWTVRAVAVLVAASTCGLAVRLFGVTSGLF